MENYNEYSFWTFFKQFKKDSTNLDLSVQYWKQNLFSKLTNMFVFENMPETMDKRILDFSLLINGNCGILRDKKRGLINVYGNFGGGEVTIYNLNSKYTWSIVGLSGVNEIGKDIVVGKNDQNYFGCGFLISKYADLLSAIDTSIKICVVNSRLTNIISASDDIAQKAVESAMTKILDGEFACVLDEMNALSSVGGIHATELFNHANSTQMLQSLYIAKESTLCEFYNEIGIALKNKDKKAQVNTSEIEDYDQMSQIRIDDMLRCREQMCEEINNMFGTNISVHLNSMFEMKKSEESSASRTDESEVEEDKDKRGGEKENV